MQTYHNQGGIIQGRAQLVREYVGNLQDNTEALRSNFSGPSAPESPAIGQTYFNITENKEYTYTSNGWVPSDHNTSVYSEVVDARGQLANLNARLSVALNEDGTLKVPAELGVDEWKDPVYGISYVSENSFTIPEDMTSVFTEGRAIKVVNGNTEVRTYVNSSEYNQQYNVTTVTTGNDVVASNISAIRYSIIQNGLPHNVASMSSLIREPNTAYAEKIKVLLPSLNVSMCLQCTTAGTTSSGDLVVSEPSIGNTVTDGTVVWTIKEIGGGGGGLWTYDEDDAALQPKDLDELTAGDLNTEEATLRTIVADVVDERLEYVPIGIMLPFMGNGAIPSGYLLCDGSAVSRTMYPDLFTAIGTTYGSGDGSTTFNLPDSNQAKRFLQGDTVAGTVKQAGLPNIKGKLGFIGQYGGNPIDGAFAKTGSTTNWPGNGTDFYPAYSTDFDASRSSAIYSDSVTTVQPHALTTRYIIKAFNGQTSDSALIDITQYAQDLAGKADKQLSNLDTNNLSVHVVVDNYYDDTTGNWYRVYDDGWVEQGGKCSEPGYITVNLLKPYKNTNYIVLKTFNTTLESYFSDSFPAVYMQAYSKTTTSFKTHTGTDSSSLTTVWYACGMGVE